MHTLLLASGQSCQMADFFTLLVQHGDWFCMQCTLECGRPGRVEQAIC